MGYREALAYVGNESGYVLGAFTGTAAAVFSLDYMLDPVNVDSFVRQGALILGGVTAGTGIGLSGALILGGAGNGVGRFLDGLTRRIEEV
tara:strand:- start:582 stop:851 length:270 start_codon:yes stop_codon:yes gene_type:complete